MDYFLNGEKIQKSEVQRDLGVLVQNSLKVESVVRKANTMSAFISTGLEYKSRDVLLRLYKALVRPRLEYSEQFWAPYLKKDVLALERIQRRFMRIIPRMKGLTYEEYLRTLGLYSMEFGKMKGYLIESDRILKGLDRVDVGKMFPLIGETSIIMKCFNRLAVDHINSSLPTCLDPLQFAFRRNTSTEDAISLALHSSLERVDNEDTYVRLLLVDYSSAFSTIIPSRFISK
eukprot:g22800.t1